MNIDPLKQLYNDFITIITNCTIKYKVEADKYETIDSKKASDAYIVCMRGEDVFETYYRFDLGVLREVMRIGDEDALYYQLNRTEIPYQYRPIILAKQREKIIAEYEEANNYYRMLNGLPDVDEPEEDYIYISESIADTLGVPSDVPIHKMENHDTAILQTNGILDQLKLSHPTKKYLNHVCDSTRIDIVTARTAKNFAMIKVPAGISNALKEKFMLIYDQCREYFMSCIYITEYRNIIDYYDNFIALCIMLMCMQQVMARTLKEVIDRNFYDDYCVRLLFEAYGVPYNAYMDTQTRTQLIQNLNLLIQNKGTNKVVYDIASILGYDRIKIYKYYLMKTQRFDYNGMPIVSYTEDEETGEKDYNYTSMYDTYFQKVAIDEEDVYHSLLDTSNFVEYNEITYPDPYWVEDEELQKELYESEYNYVETKYMGVSISYRLSRILFENVYLLRMLFDKKDEIGTVTLDLPKITEYNEVTLFDAVVILCAMTCKQNHLKGEIIMQPSGILHVMGFDFVNDFAAIREEIQNDPYIEEDILSYFVNSTTYTAEGVNRLYQNYLDLYYALLDKMTTTQNIKVYQAYKKLYETIFYNHESERMFNIGSLSEPVYAKTYMEYLQAKLPDVYEFINQVDVDGMYTYINHIAQKMTKVVSDLKYIGAMSDGSSTMETMLIDLIRFFKSYTTDMLGFETIYILDMKPDTLLRLIDWVALHVNLWIDDQLPLSYADTVTFTSTVRYSSKISMIDKIKYIHAGLWIFDTLNFFDKCIIHANLYVGDNVTYYSIIQHMYAVLQLEAKITFQDALAIYKHLKVQDSLTFEDFCRLIITISLETSVPMFDVLKMYKVIASDDLFVLFDKIAHTITKTQLKDHTAFEDLVHAIHVNVTPEDLFALEDAFHAYVRLIEKDKVHFFTAYFMKITIYIHANMAFLDRIHLISVRIWDIQKLYFYDTVTMYSSVQYVEKLYHNEKWYFYIHLQTKDRFELYKDVLKISSRVIPKDQFALLDASHIYKRLLHGDPLLGEEAWAFTTWNNIHEYVSFYDKLAIFKDIMYEETAGILDSVGIYKVMPWDEVMNFDGDIWKFHVNEEVDESLTLEEKLKIYSRVEYQELFYLPDFAQITSSDSYRDILPWKEVWDYHSNHTFKETMPYTEVLDIHKDVKYEDLNHMLDYTYVYKSLPYNDILLGDEVLDFSNRIEYLEPLMLDEHYQFYKQVHYQELTLFDDYSITQTLLPLKSDVLLQEVYDINKHMTHIEPLPLEEILTFHKNMKMIESSEYVDFTIIAELLPMKEVLAGEEVYEIHSNMDIRLDLPYTEVLDTHKEVSYKELYHYEGDIINQSHAKINTSMGMRDTCKIRYVES